jgi:hypothetical protein
MKRANVFLLSSSILLVACSDAPTATNDAGDDAATLDAGPDAFAPAPHADAPTVENAGGVVLANPKLVVVTFSNDPLAPQIESFAQSIGASAYWSATTSEYGVGAATYAGAVHVDAPPASPLTQDAFESWLSSQLDGTHADWPAYDASTIYSVVFPAGSGVMVDGVAACKSAPAYHFEIPSSGKSILYAAENRCDPLFGLAGIDYVTAGLSHEWIEAATDPHYITGPAFEQPASKYGDWTLTTGGEVADMCTNRSDVYFKPADLPFTVQRSWSNASAIAGHDPCVPAQDGAYFAAAPSFDATVHGTYEGESFVSEGEHVAIGASVAIEVDLFSDAPSDPFDVSAQAFAGENLAFSWDQTSGSNGDKLMLTITRKGDGANMSGADFFTVLAKQNGRQSAWLGAIGN